MRASKASFACTHGLWPVFFVPENWPHIIALAAYKALANKASAEAAKRYLPGLNYAARTTYGTCAYA